MADSIEVTFASGNKVRFGSRSGGGLEEVGIGDRLVPKAGEMFERAMGALGDVVSRLEAAVGGLAHRPKSVEIEFSASLKGDCDLWVVSGSGAAEFKVTLRWGRA